jgi:hypothetical protein
VDRIDAEQDGNAEPGLLGELLQFQGGSAQDVKK